ncbi:MAG: hypothetical protein U0360_10805 [Dehalococcoidia bacterium]
MTLDAPFGAGNDPRRNALATLTLAELEEAAGELQRRIGVALRRIGERDADSYDTAGRSPRRQAARLAVECEVTALALAARAAGLPGSPRVPAEHPTFAAAIAYGAPNLPALVSRLEQDRRVLASLARQLESRLDEPLGASEPETPRELLIRALIEAPARAALAFERFLDERDA